MGIGRPLGAKLFLEGYEVPFIGATFTTAVDQASIAYIDLVPHASINNIKPRTHVMLAVRDYNNPKAKYPYVLAWEGEVFGYSYGKTSNSRSFTIQCIDNTSYWDNALTYFFNTQQDLGKGAPYVGGASMDKKDGDKQGIETQVITHATASYFVQTIATALSKAGNDFLDGFIAVYNKIVRINQFYELAEARLRIIDRIRLKSSGALQELLKANEALNWFSGVIGRDSGFATLRSVVQNLMGLIFHDFAPIPFPARVQAKTLTGKSLVATEKKKYTIGNFIFKPNLFMLPPPMCNVFFPEEYSNFQFSRNFFREPTRLIYKPELPRFQSDASVAMGHAYEPPSFQNFMLGKKATSEFTGTDDFAVTVSNLAPDPGKFGDKDETQFAESNQGVKREGQFLTNEERLKGIWMAQEQQVPASTQYRQSLSDAGKQVHILRTAKYLFYKKRFQERPLQITSHLKLSVVPGMTVLLLDDSDAEQSTVAYCSSVTHRIYATEGGFTNVILSYARNIKEDDISSDKGSEPPVPTWFDELLFGSVTTPPASEAAPDVVKARGPQYVTSSHLSDFYKTLLGDKGTTAITNRSKKEPTLVGAVKALLNEYRGHREKSTESLQSFIADITGRDYVLLQDAWDFIGGKTATPPKDFPTTPFIRFLSDQLAGKGTADEPFIKARQAVIAAYQGILKTTRGFRG